MGGSGCRMMMRRMATPRDNEKDHGRTGHGPLVVRNRRCLGEFISDREKNCGIYIL